MDRELLSVFFVLQNGFCLLWVFHKPLPSATFVLYCLEHTGGISTSCSVRQKTNSSQSSLSSKEHLYGKWSAFRIKEDIRVSGFNIRIKNEHCVVIFNMLLYFLSFTSFYTLFLLTLIKKVLKKLWGISLNCATAYFEKRMTYKKRLLKYRRRRRICMYLHNSINPKSL